MPVEYREIEPADAGQRLDNFLMRVLKGVPRSLVYRIVRSGEVRVNAGRVKAGYRLVSGDQVRIPPLRTAAETPVHIPVEVGQRLMAEPVYEDKTLLAVNKPAGMAVHGGSGVAYGMVEALRQASGNPRLELVHRLDRETSGVLLLAKTRPALKAAQQEFRLRRVSKIYTLIVHGHWSAGQVIAQQKLQRYTTSWGERRVRVDARGQTARTDFEVVETTPTYSRLQARLHTGRTHQIRVHTAHRGHPIVGDEKYKNPTQQPPAHEQEVVTRMCLHATKLALQIGDLQLKLKAPPGPDFETIWEQLQLFGSS